MSSRNLDLLIVSGAAILALAITLLPSNLYGMVPNPYRMAPNGTIAGYLLIGWLPILALPLILALPGYALTAAWFPRDSLGLAETLAGSIGLSLAADIVGGVVLSFTADGLTPLAWATFLVIVTLGACAFAARNRTRQPAPAFKSSSLRFDIRAVLFFAASILVVVGALAIVRDETLQPSTAFTLLWAKPATLLGQTAFDIGVHNSESKRMEYELEVKVGDTPFESLTIALAPGETWEKVVVFKTRVNGDVQVSLYRMEDRGTIYRQVVSRSGTE